LKDRGLTPSELDQFVDRINDNAAHLLALIDDLLDLSTIESGAMTRRREPVDVARLMEGVRQTMLSRAEEKSLALTCTVSDKVPQGILTDPTRLRQILTNLVGNAIKFTPSGAVHLDCRPGPGATLRFWVRDTGIGMNPADIHRIFDPFSQLDSSDQRCYVGFGLGLAICRKLTELLDGRLYVTSEQGEGSCFLVEIPLTQVVAPPVGRPFTRRRRGKTRRRSSVLIAEDSPDLQLLMSRTLMAAGLRVHQVTDGRAACRAVLQAQSRGRPFDLVIMDMQMPEMNGYQATRDLRAQGYSGLVVAHTAHAMQGERERCLDAGCDGYLPKPVLAEDLKEFVLQFIDRQAS
jgi:CheY-like chemotaxis protein